MAKPYIYNLGQYFQRIVEDNRENSAVVFIDGQSISYERINALSNQLARFLLSRGLMQGDVVAIHNEKTAVSYALMLACLKIGAVYTNLDPNSPLERINRMLSVCMPKLFFAGRESLQRIRDYSIPSESVYDYSSDEFLSHVEKLDSDELKECASVTANVPAYIMFTSGSTGFPKGVVITHGNVLNFIAWTKEVFNPGPDDRMTSINPMHFDNSVFDFYGALFNGAALVAVPESSLKVPRRLLDTLNQLQPTIWFSVPSLLVYILKMRALKETDLANLRIISFGGEGFPKSQLRKLWDMIGGRVTFVNVYGPTEGTCICSSYTVKKEDMLDDNLLPLGPIASNFDFLILNDALEKVADNEVGELCLSGPNVAKGYYNNPDRTKEAFIQHPYMQAYHEKIYRTGDLVRYDPGNDLLIFCGRADNQIKRMGYRIELEEIENALAALGYIEENAVIYHKTDDTSGLIIACVCSSMQDEAAVLNDLRKYLPSYMIPNKLVFMGSLPKNRNGKIDRLALKEEYCR